MSTIITPLYLDNEHHDIDIEDYLNEEEDGENEDPDINQHMHKQLTKNRLVHDINSALDIENYNEYEIPDQLKKHTGVIKDAKDKNNMEQISFTNKTKQH